MSELRLLNQADIPDLLALCRAAGWNQSEGDWLRLLQLAPEGCLGVEEGGRIVSSTTSLRYGRELAWVGMVLTHPDHRGRGHARSLLNHSLDLLRYREVNWIKLDATEAGKPIYEAMGFIEEGPIERWRRQPAPFDEAPPDNLFPFIYDPVLDRRGFGANRTALLRELAEVESACLPTTAYAMGRPGHDAAYFGPCVSRTAEATRMLLEWFLSRHWNELIYWDLLPANHSAAEIARQYGFEPVRNLARMGMQLNPPSLNVNEAAVYAIAGFELG